MLLRHELFAFAHGLLAFWRRPGKCGRHGIDDLHGFQTRADHLPDEPHDVLRVIFAVGAAGDAAAGVSVDWY